MFVRKAIGMHCMKKFALLIATFMILTAFGSIDAVASDGSLLGYFTDNGWDSDYNGLYDKLNVTIYVDVTISGQFRINSYLFNYSGNQQIDSCIFDIVLVVGNNSVLLQYQGMKIRSSEIDGPFLVLVHLYNDAMGLLDSEQIFTSPYSYTEFDRYPLEYTGVHSDYAYNVDNDPRFDFLRVNATYNVWKNGTYRMSASLYDPSGTVLIDTYKINDFYNFYATVGTINFSFDFKGMKIFTSGFDGQYRIRIEWFTVEENYWRYDPYFLTNEAYNHSWFQPPGILPTRMVEQVTDTDGDSFYDELALVFHVEIEVPGAYGLYVIANHGGWEVGRTSDNIGDLYMNTGNYTISCSFDVGHVMDQHSANASFVVTVSSNQYSSGVWTSLGTKVFTTATAYNSSDFKRKVAQAEIVGGPFCDFIDADGDGKYDRINTTVNISCGVEDAFILSIYLFNYGGMQKATSAQKEIHAIAGTTQAHLTLPVWPVNVSQVNSPYRIVAYLYTMDWGQIQYLSGIISETYNWTDFNGTRPVEISIADDFGIDYDEDGKYDVLAVQLSADWREPTTCNIYAYLRNDTTTVGYYSWFGSHLGGDGIPVVLFYSGVKIRKGAIESPYHLDLVCQEVPAWNSFSIDNMLLLHSYSPDMFEDPEQTSVAGQVIDEDTEEPVVDAIISGVSYVWGTNSSTTNSTGWFSMNLSSGLISITVTKSEYITRTLYMEVNGPSATCVLGIKKIKPQDSIIKGFVKFRDGNAIPPSTVNVMYVGDHSFKELSTGPNGYYEIPARSGPIILRFGQFLREYGTVKVDLQASTTLWRNFTLKAGNSENEYFEYLLIDWSHGRLNYEYFVGSYSATKDALWADVFFGDSNGILSAEEAGLYASYRLRGFDERFETSQYMLVDDTCYFLDYGKMAFNAKGMTGALENIVSVTYYATAPFSTRTSIAPSDSKSIKLRLYLDYEDISYGTYSCSYKIQLPNGFGLARVDSSVNVSVSGTSLVAIDPSSPSDRTLYESEIVLIVGASSEEQETCTLIGRAMLSDSSSHRGILVEVLDADGDKLGSAFTDLDGNYSILGLPCDEMVVKATRSGYHPAGLVASLTSTGLTSLPDIVLYPSTIANFVGSMNCTVMDVAGPISEAIVTLRYIENSTLIATLTTDENGRFEIHGLLPGAILLNISAKSYLPFEALEFINGLETIETTYVLALPTGEIRGRIIDDRGIAHEGIVIKLYDFAGQLVATTTTNSTGYFVLEHIPDGYYNISIYWQDKNIENITNIVVANGTLTDIGTITLPASVFGAPVDLTLFIIVAAAIILVILGILWFMRRPPAKKEPMIEKLRPEEGIIVEEENRSEPERRRNEKPGRRPYDEDR